MCTSFLVLWAALVSLPIAEAIDNGLALSPPMGWRSWNLFTRNVDQGLIEGIMDGMVVRKRMDHLGQPTSLCDLGYCDVGLDDNWQACDDPRVEEGMNFHDKDGRPVVNLERFPDMKQMVNHAHDLNLTAGWYQHNCICADHCESKYQCERQIEGDIEALLYFGFDAVKVDGCGGNYDPNLVKFNRKLTEMADRPILVENCHSDSVQYKPDLTKPPSEGCPYHFYRTSRDIRPHYASVMSNLASVHQYYEKNETYPGCWAYPDMLQVGVFHHDQHRLDMRETRSHFGAWAIVSSPLVLSHDVNDDDVTDLIWDVISNREAIAINQAYIGDSGGLYAWSKKNVDLVQELKAGTDIVTVPARQYFSKMLGGGKVAVLLMNCIEDSTFMQAIFTDIPGLKCKHDDCQYYVRDVWNHRDVGIFEGSYSVAVDGHDAAFLVLEYVDRSS